MAFLGKLEVKLLVDATALKKVAASIVRTAQIVDSAAKRMTTSMKKVGQSMKSVGRSLTMYVTTPIMAFGVASTKVFMDFEASLAKVVGLVGLSQETVDSWANSVKNMAVGVGKGPTELADALYFITSAGIRSSEALDVLKKSAEASAAGMGKTKLIADLVTSAMNAFGKSHLSAAKAVDILAETVKEGKSEATALATTMGMVLPIAAELGAGFDQVGAGMAMMTRTGTTAATAAMQLRQIFNSILKPSKQASEAMEAMGTSGEKLRKTLREKGLLSTLKEIRTLTNLYGEDIMGRVFPNIRALSGVLDIMGKNFANNITIENNLRNATGRNTKAFEAAAHTLKFRFNQALASVKRAMTDLGQSMRKYLIPLFETFTKKLMALVDWYNNLGEAGQKTILIITALVVAIGPLITILGFLIANILPALIGGLNFVISVLGVLSALIVANPLLFFAGLLGVIILKYVAWKHSIEKSEEALKKQNKETEKQNKELEKTIKLQERLAKIDYSEGFKALGIPESIDNNKGMGAVAPISLKPMDNLERNLSGAKKLFTDFFEFLDKLIYNFQRVWEGSFGKAFHIIFGSVGIDWRTINKKAKEYVDTQNKITEETALEKERVRLENVAKAYLDAYKAKRDFVNLPFETYKPGEAFGGGVMPKGTELSRAQDEALKNLPEVLKTANYDQLKNKAETIKKSIANIKQGLEEAQGTYTLEGVLPPSNKAYNQGPVNWSPDTSRKIIDMVTKLKPLQDGLKIVNETLASIDKETEAWLKDWKGASVGGPNLLDIGRATTNFIKDMKKIDGMLSLNIKGFDEAKERVAAFGTVIEGLVEAGALEEGFGRKVSETGKILNKGFSFEKIISVNKEVKKFLDSLDIHSLKDFVKYYNKWLTILENEKAYKKAIGNIDKLKKAMDDFAITLAFISLKKELVPDFDWATAYQQALEKTRDDLLKLKAEAIVDLKTNILTPDTKGYDKAMEAKHKQLEDIQKQLDRVMGMWNDFMDPVKQTTRVMTKFAAETAKVTDHLDAFGTSGEILAAKLVPINTAIAGLQTILKTAKGDLTSTKAELDKLMETKAKLSIEIVTDTLQKKLGAIDLQKQIYIDAQKLQGFKTLKEYLLSIGSTWDANTEKVNAANMAFSSLMTLIQTMPDMDLSNISSAFDVIIKKYPEMKSMFEELMKILKEFGKSVDDTTKQTAKRMQLVFRAAKSLFDNLAKIIEAQKQRELSAVGQNAKKREEIERAYFEKQKRMSIAQALINGALAITNIFATVPGGEMNPAAWVAVAITVANTATQVGVIAAQSFEDGGVIYGETLARVGEYSGASTNPEIIAPLNKLSAILHKELNKILKLDQFVPGISGGNISSNPKSELREPTFIKSNSFQKQEVKVSGKFEIEREKLIAVIDSYVNEKINL